MAFIDAFESPSHELLLLPIGGNASMDSTLLLVFDLLSSSCHWWSPQMHRVRAATNSTMFKQSIAVFFISLVCFLIVLNIIQINLYTWTKAPHRTIAQSRDTVFTCHTLFVHEYIISMARYYFQFCTMITSPKRRLMISIKFLVVDLSTGRFDSIEFQYETKAWIQMVHV